MQQGDGGIGGIGTVRKMLSKVGSRRGKNKERSSTINQPGAG